MKKTKKEQILETALELFGTNGYNSTSTNKIAKAAGVSEGLIFSHFGSKSGLAEALIESAEQKTSLIFADIIAEENPKQVLKKTLSGIFTFAESELNYWKLMIKLKWEIDYNHPEKFAPLLKKLTETFTQLDYKHPEMEAQLILQIIESMLGSIVKGEKQQQKQLKNYLIEKYKL